MYTLDKVRVIFRNYLDGSSIIMKQLLFYVHHLDNIWKIILQCLDSYLYQLCINIH